MCLRLICNIYTLPHVSGEVLFSKRLSVCLSARSSDMIPVSEVQVPSNMSIALTLCFLCYLGSSSQCSSVRRKMCQSPNTATLQYDALFVRIDLHVLCSSICRLPPNRANGVAVFKGSPIRYSTPFYEPSRLHRDVAKSDILSETKWRFVHGVHHNYSLICLYDRNTVERYDNHPH